MAPWGSFARAICTRRGERSRPVTRAPRAARTRARNPSPQPASSTSRPGRSPRRSSMGQRMASRSRSACSRRAINWPYSAAYSSHGLAFDAINSHLAGERLLRRHGHLGCPPTGLCPPALSPYVPGNGMGDTSGNAAEDGATPFDTVMEGETPGDDWEQAIATVRPLAEAGLTWYLKTMYDNLWSGRGLQEM